MHDTAERTALVSTRLDQLLRVEIRIPVADFPADEWDQVDADLGERFGFLWPRRFEDGIIVAYSAEVIAQQTLGLDDAQLGHYLDLLELMLADYVADLGRHPERPHDERRRLVEDQLWDLRPASVHWLSEVQLQILDAAYEGNENSQAA